MKNLLSIIIIAGTGIALWWMMSTQRDTLLDKPGAPASGISAYMNNFTMSAMDEDGELAVRLRAEQLRYRDTRDAELDRPELRLLENGEARWHITADQGLIDDEGQHLVFESNVNISSKDSDDPIIITTEKLAIDIDKQLASTEASVTLRNSDTRLVSNGMVLDNNKGTLELLAKVRGDHAPR